MKKHWPHAPPHRTLSQGTYMVTGATHQKILHFKSKDRLQFLQDTLLDLAKEYGWDLQAWAILANHYHFMAKSPEHSENLSDFLSHLHVVTARYINLLDDKPNRRVWWQYWDSHITYQYSYLARLNYINQNPVRHGIVDDPKQYPWCSACWFEETSLPAFRKTVYSFKIDKLNVIDDF